MPPRKKKEEPIETVEQVEVATPIEPTAEPVEQSDVQDEQRPRKFHLDWDLTPEERQEWENIYASKRSNSLLSGEIIGIDSNYIQMQTEDGVQDVRMLCAIVITHRAKVIVPETEIWVAGTEQSEQVFRNMIGATIDYVILSIDYEGGCAIASRRLALETRRRYYRNAPRGHTKGEEILSCNVLSVGPTICLVNCNGYDIPLRARDLSYTSVSDLRSKYQPGQSLRCVLMDYDAEYDSMDVSVKLATKHPFDGADQRHPVGSRRRGVISGKYNGGIFVVLSDGLTVLCRYTQFLLDSNFALEDNVIIVIRAFDYERKEIFGQILTKR